MMQRRSFLRSGLAATVAAPGLLSLPDLGRAIEAASGAAPSRAPRRLAKPIWLSRNENPLGMPESARQAVIDALVDGNRYPSLDAQLGEAIAKKHGVPRERVVLGTGSTEVLRMAVQSVAGSGARLVTPDPTYEHMAGYATPFGIETIKVPLRRDWAMDLAAMRRAAERTRGRALVFLCNPNNPTATLTRCDEIQAWIEGAGEKITFLVDEAYFDFVDDPAYRTLIPLTARPNVIVSRTFSKIYGLAGLRLGYGIASAETAKRLTTFATRNSVNHVAAAAALACSEDHEFMRRSVAINRQGRDFVYRIARELGLEALPSHANFVFHRINGEIQPYIDRMAEAGVRVGRPFPPMLNYNRISIGLPEEMEVWAEALRELRKKGWV
jgi:histidinol-phosphate aminotransferase